MKRIIFAAAAAFGILFGAQFSATAQVEQGSFIIDPYVGAPTGNMWWNNFENEDNFKTVGGPIGYGGRLEYMVADNFGVGLDVNYVKTGYEYTSTCLGCGAYDSTSMTYADVTETIGYEAKKLRIMVRMNYHFVQTEALDVYAALGVGYANKDRTFYLDGEVDGDASIPTIIPIATRFALGMRYYFAPYIGVNFELGAGGGQIAQLGVSVKI